MSDRTYVSLSVHAPNHTLTIEETRVYRQLCGGEDINLHMEAEVCEEESGYTGAGEAISYFGQSEVRVGANDATKVVDLMRAGIIPKRTFSLMEDGYGDAAGWLTKYDADNDRVVTGPAHEGCFMIGLDTLMDWYETHHRNADALMRMIIRDYNVRLPVPKSYVVDVIDKINRQHI